MSIKLCEFGKDMFIVYVMSETSYFSVDVSIAAESNSNQILVKQFFAF